MQTQPGGISGVSSGARGDAGGLRRVHALERAGNQARARGVLWGLVLTAIVVLVPVVVAAVIPQQATP